MDVFSLDKEMSGIGDDIAQTWLLLSLLLL